MKIEFVNHSSLLVDARGVRLVCDPWLDGTAFNDGWALLSPSAFRTEDWSRVTHIWHSHEHPDHFSPATLRAIPEADRRRIAVLYQTAPDGKVAEFCRKAGFGSVIEMAPDRWYALAPGVEVRCEPWVGGDSWLAVRTPEATLLNVNDCGIYTLEETARIRATVGRVDVLATQFSLSAWEGNPEEAERRRIGAQQMLDRMVVHCQGFEPRWTLPFASFVWFCHDENFYMNAEINRIEVAVEALEARTASTPLVMYPGDVWEVGAAVDSASAVARYARDYDSLPSRPRFQSRPVPAPQLEEAARVWCGRVLDGLPALRLRLRLARQEFRRRCTAPGAGAWARAAALAGLALLQVSEAAVWITDLDAAYVFSVFSGLRRSPRREAECDVAMSSDSLRYAFQFLWGGESLQVNGRFREVRADGRLPLFQHFWLAIGRNRGESIGWRDLVRRGIQRGAR